MSRRGRFDYNHHAYKYSVDRRALIREKAPSRCQGGEGVLRRDRECHMYGIGGLTVSRLWGEIARYVPSTVILDIGTNCLSCVSTRPECLAREIVEIARAIRRLPSVRVVVVMPIITTIYKINYYYY